VKEYFLIWRALPKLFIGVVFILELFAVLFGKRRLESFLEVSKHSLTSLFSGATLLVAAVLLFMIIAGMGLFLLDTFSAFIRRAAKMASPLFPRSWAACAVLRKLFLDPYALALGIFRDRGSFYLDYMSLKSTSGGVENLVKSTEIKGFAVLVDSHLKSAKPADIESISFYGMLGQDRRAVEIIADDIQMLESLVVILLFAPVVLWPILDTPVELLNIGVALGAGLLLLAEIADRRLFLGGVLLASYLDYFVVHEGAEVADREGEPVL